jgi:adenylate cyclase
MAVASHMSLGRSPVTPVVYADLVGFTSFAEVHEERVVTEALDLFDEIVREYADLHDLRVVKGLGDAYLLQARSGPNALGFSMSLLEAMDERAPLAVHVGVHAGPVIERQNDIFGKTVNLAGRLAAMARPDEILLTRDVLEGGNLSKQLAPVSVGPQRVRGVPNPVDLLSLRLDRSIRPTDPVCRMKVPEDTFHTSTAFKRTYRFCSEGCASIFARRPNEFFDAMLRGRRSRALRRSPSAGSSRGGTVNREAACALTGF